MFNFCIMLQSIFMNLHSTVWNTCGCALVKLYFIWRVYICSWKNVQGYHFWGTLYTLHCSVIMRSLSCKQSSLKWPSVCSLCCSALLTQSTDYSNASQQLPMYTVHSTHLSKLLSCFLIVSWYLCCSFLIRHITFTQACTNFLPQFFQLSLAQSSSAD